MVVILSVDTPESVNKGRPKMSTETLILLTPDFFNVNITQNTQFEDAETLLVQETEKKNKQSPLLVPPTLEGLSSFSSNVNGSTLSAPNLPDSLAVVPFLQSADHTSSQLLPFRQHFAPYGADSRNNSYLSICQSEIPLGIFWDVENVRLPKNKSAAAVIEAIRRKFLVQYKEAEFLVVCDAFKERKSLLMDFNSAQVTVVHVPCISKNAADDKLRQCMRRFIDNTGNPCAVMLISSDVNFSVDLSDFKNRKKIRVILVHGPLASEALILSSNEHYLFDDIIDLVPATPQTKALNKTLSVYLEVINLPPNVPEMSIRSRLERIAENCGGKVSEVHRNRALVRFTSSSVAERALLRMNGEDVFGRKIVVQKLHQADRVSSNDVLQKRTTQFPPPPNPAKVAPPTLLAFPKKPTTTNTLNNGAVDNEGTYHRPFYCTDDENTKERHGHLTSESSGHISCDEVTPQLSSDYDEEIERSEKESKSRETKEHCDDFNVNRSRVKHLMSNIPQKSLAFNDFQELFKLSFNCSITLSELTCMNDMLLVTENSRGPFLLFRKANSEKMNNLDDPKVPTNEVAHKPRCELHDGSADCTEDEELLLVNSALKALNKKVVRLLKRHNGSVPLGSFPKCYAAQFGALNFDQENGVPLEQLFAFMKNISIVSKEDHHKLVQLRTNCKETDPKSSWNPLLLAQLNVLSNEMVDLLKTAPSFRIPFNGFNAAYCDHFSRQCKVSDYGYHRLVDLFEAMPHVVQVIGEGTHRYLTLSHDIHINRFKSDVIKVLKNQSNKTVALKNFEKMFEKATGKAFKPQNYGLCKLDDLLSLLVESKAIVFDDDVIAMPMKELTEEQMTKVKEFSIEVVKLLKGAPNYSMPFSTFIPAYHVNFGKQCRLSLYGCSKLVELLDRISDVVEVVDVEKSSEKLVRLNLTLRLETLGHQLVDLIKKRCGQLLVDTLPDVFRKTFKFFLDPRDFDCADIYELLAKLQDFVQVVRSKSGDEVRLGRRSMAPFERTRVLKMLFATVNGSMNVEQLLNEYKSTYADDCQFDFNDSDTFTIDGDNAVVKLSPIIELGRLLLVLINENGGKVALSVLEKRFIERFGFEFVPSNYGHESIVSVLARLSNIVTVKGKGAKKGITASQSALDLAKSVIVSGGHRRSEDYCSTECVNEGATSDDLSAKPTIGTRLTKPPNSRIAAIFPS